MQKAAQYRVFANECRELADNMNLVNRETLLKIAEAWEKLATEKEAAAREKEIAGRKESADL